MSIDFFQPTGFTSPSQALRNPAVIHTAIVRVRNTDIQFLDVAIALSKCPALTSIVFVSMGDYHKSGNYWIGIEGFLELEVVAKCTHASFITLNQYARAIGEQDDLPKVEKQYAGYPHLPVDLDRTKEAPEYDGPLRIESVLFGLGNPKQLFDFGWQIRQLVLVFDSEWPQHRALARALQVATTYPIPYLVLRGRSAPTLQALMLHATQKHKTIQTPVLIGHANQQNFMNGHVIKSELLRAECKNVQALALNSDKIITSTVLDDLVSVNMSHTLYTIGSTEVQMRIDHRRRVWTTALMQPMAIAAVRANRLNMIRDSMATATVLKPVYDFLFNQDEAVKHHDLHVPVRDDIIDDVEVFPKFNADANARIQRVLDSKFAKSVIGPIPVAPVAVATPVSRGVKRKAD